MVAAVNPDMFVGAVVDRIQNALYQRVHGFKRRQLVVLTKAVVLYARHQKNIRRSIVVLVCIGLLSRLRQMIKLTTSQRKLTDAKSGGPRQKAQLDRQFFENMQRLVGIAIPGLLSKEFGMLVAHTVLLVFRTFLSVVVATLDGQIVSSLVRLRGREFLVGIAKWMGMAVPATLTNSLLGYVQTMLAIRFRQNLTEHVHAKYLANNTYYA
ncbi:ATP-binding cassette long-chain fatty acid transporter pxa2, partial [Coemansia sp. RSA 2131]